MLFKRLPFTLEPLNLDPVRLDLDPVQIRNVTMSRNQPFDCFLRHSSSEFLFQRIGHIIFDFHLSLAICHYVLN
jgi:hypothetical protein